MDGLTPWGRATQDADDVFAASTQSVPEIIFGASATGCVDYLNPRWHRYTGRTVRDSLGEAYLTSVHPDDAGRIALVWQEALASGEEATTEARLRRHDGEYRWHRLTLAPHAAEAGQRARWLGSIVDIDSTRSAERAFRTLAETVKTLVWAALPDGYVDYYNVRWTDRVADLEVLIDDGWQTLVHPDDLDAAIEAWALSLATGEEYVARLRLRMRDGTYRWHESTANAEYDSSGRIVRWYGTTVDVHENVGLRDALRSQDALARLYREFAKSTPSLLLTIEPNGRLEFINERWSEILGIPPEALHAVDWRAFVDPDDHASIGRLVAEHAVSGEPYVGEWRVTRSDRSFRWIEIRLSAERDAAGSIVRWYGSGFDIDPMRRANDALALLAESGENIDYGESIESLLASVARASLGGIADLSIFDFREAGKSPQRIAIGSPGYEKAVAVVQSLGADIDDATTPIARSIMERRSIVQQIVDDDYIAHNVAPLRRQKAWRDIGVRSILCVPLALGQKSYASLTLLRVGTSGYFDWQDLRVAEEIARRTSVAIENIRLREEARSYGTKREERFRRIADAIPQLMWVTGADDSVEWVNERWIAFTGRSLEESIATDWISLVHPDDREETRERWRASSANGSVFEQEYRLRAANGTYRYFLARATPVETSAGRRWYGTNTDIDEARRAARTLAVFAHVGEELSESLGLQQTLDAVMQVTVPDFSDWAFITLADESKDLYVRAVYHARAETSAALGAAVGLRYARASKEIGSPAAMRARQPILYSHAVYEDAARVVEPDVMKIMWDAVGYESVIVIPLIVGSAVRGTLTVCMSGSRRIFTLEDVPFFKELGRRIAPAIANAESYERERHVARTFQQAALPVTLPATDGYIFSAVYEAGRAEALVGGDWYDAFSLTDGRIVVSIGDVAGSGLRAAVTMANVRQAIRGVAHVHADPELMLEAGDRALRAENPESFATAFVGVIDPIAQTISYKSAGHSPALVALADGTIAELAIGGLPLGLRTADRKAPFVAPLEIGSALYLYTDGLTESTRDMLEGEARLRVAIDANHRVAPQERAQAIYRAVLVDGSSDDVAILCVSVVPRAVPLRWTLDVRDADATKRTRGEIFVALGIANAKPSVVNAAEMIFAELVGNLLRYAPLATEIVLERDGGRPVLHVRDRGPGFEFMPKLPPDPYSENGRGLFLISALAADFNVTRRIDGGSHARVVFAT